ncbi:MAG: hypothetical protein Q4C75_00375, partial [Bergeyella zoohelcum]|nr:hypothetical protein [Bergeyella zoohelcum]
MNLFLLVCISGLGVAQTLKLEYDFYDKSPVMATPFHKIATVYYDLETKEMLYEVSQPINTDMMEKTESFVVERRDNFKYQLYKNETNKMLILDKPQDEICLFEDVVLQMEWKEIGKHQMETHFRGRDYVVSYIPDDKISVAPWKFTEIKGVAKEIYTKDGKYKWVLKSKQNIKGKISNPFPMYSYEKLPYTEYPEKAYGLPLELKK